MSLVERLPFHEEIVDAPPIKLDLSDVAIPEQVELTFVGGMHDARFSKLDFLESALSESDILAMEMCGWSEATAKTVRSVAKGSYKDLQKLVAREQEFAKTARSGYDTNTGQAAWNEKYYRAIYGAKSPSATPLRIMTPDYPANHSKMNTGIYAKSLGRFSLAALRHLEPSEQDLEAMADREIFIAQSVCKAIADVRKNDPRLKNKTPLRVIMPYGTMHYAVAEALAFQANESGVDSFKTNILFEPMENLNGGLKDAEFQDAYSQTYNGIPVYQNWLRAA